MWFFDWFETYFGYISDKFEFIADAIDGVPVIGDYLAYPFDNIATFFSNLKTASEFASGWADDIVNDVSNIIDDTLGWVSELWDETDLIWERIGAIPVLTIDTIKSWVMPWINSAISVLEDVINDALDTINNTISTISDNLSAVNEWIENAPGFINVHIDNAKDKILGWMEASFILILEKVLEHEKEE